LFIVVRVLASLVKIANDAIFRLMCLADDFKTLLSDYKVAKQQFEEVLAKNEVLEKQVAELKGRLDQAGKVKRQQFADVLDKNEALEKQAEVLNETLEKQVAELKGRLDQASKVGLQRFADVLDENETLKTQVAELKSRLDQVAKLAKLS
jgi:uncharacterized protein YceH (UPF0502 family)